MLDCWSKMDSLVLQEAVLPLTVTWVQLRNAIQVPMTQPLPAERLGTMAIEGDSFVCFNLLQRVLVLGWQWERNVYGP